MTTSATETTVEAGAEGASGTAEAGQASETTPDGAATAETGAGDSTETLGDKGKQALDRMKAERKAALDRAKAAEAERDALKADAEGRKAEHDAAQERKATEDAAIAKANERILRADVRAAAAGKLSDPADALRFLDLSEFEVDSDGGTDEEAISAAIEDLIAKKPYLAAQGGRRFEGKGDGGHREGSHTPAQLTDADVKRLSAEGKHAEIVQAKKEGRLNKVLGIT